MEQYLCCICFEGGGGHLGMTASEGEQEASVELETREWDFQAKHSPQGIT
jgi:hypothetical protein